MGMVHRMVITLAGMLFCLLAPFAVYAQGGEGGVPVPGKGISLRPRLTFSTFPTSGFADLFSVILKEAYEPLGYDVIIERLPAERALIMSNGGVVDGEAGRLTIIEENNQNLVRVPTSIYKTRVVGFTRNSDIDLSDGWESLRKYKIGVLIGYKYVESKTDGMNRLLVPTGEKLMGMLDAGRVDIVILSVLDGLLIVKEQRLKGIHVIEPPLGAFSMYHYLHTKNEDLIPLVDEQFRQLRDSGRLDAIVREREASLSEQ